MPALCDIPAKKSDRHLARQIARQLAETRRAALRRLEVEVHDDEVIVSGRVSSFYEKQIAIHACRLLAGSQRLIDAVEVAS